MTQLHYATADSDTDLHADDEHAYRFKPAAWRFAWLWWNLVLLVLMTVMLRVLVTDQGTLKVISLTDIALNTSLQTAPLAIAMSLLLAHRKVDLSFPMQLYAGVYFSQWLSWKLDFAEPLHLATSVLITVATGALIGVLHWCLCTLLRAPSALTTLLIGGVLPIAGFALTGRERWPSGTPWNTDFLALTKLALCWGPLVVTLVAASLTTIWLLIRRNPLPPPRQRRRESIAELIGFLLVGIVCAMTSASIGLDPSSSRPGVGTTTGLVGVLAAAFVGGTLYRSKLPNPLGALLGSVVIGTMTPVVLKLVGATRTDPMAGMLAVAGIAVAMSCVVLGYSARLRTLLGAMTNPSLPRPRASFVGLCCAVAALMVLIFAVAMVPLALVEPNVGRARADPTIGAARATLCLAAAGASATYILLYAADALICRLTRNRT